MHVHCCVNSKAKHWSLQDKKSKKDKKKKSKEDDAEDDKDYLKEAMFGKKEDTLGVDSDGDGTSVASETGVDDEGAMSK